MLQISNFVGAPKGVKAISLFFALFVPFYIYITIENRQINMSDTIGVELSDPYFYFIAYFRIMLCLFLAILSVFVRSNVTPFCILLVSIFAGFPFEIFISAIDTLATTNGQQIWNNSVYYYILFALLPPIFMFAYFMLSDSSKDFYGSRPFRK